MTQQVGVPVDVRSGSLKARVNIRDLDIKNNPFARILGLARSF